MDKDVKALHKELIKLTWIMRGGVNIDQAYAMSPLQREEAFKLFEQNLEATSKTGLPFF